MTYISNLKEQFEKSASKKPEKGQKNSIRPAWGASVLGTLGAGAGALGGAIAAEGKRPASIPASSSFKKKFLKSTGKGALIGAAAGALAGYGAGKWTETDAGFDWLKKKEKQTREGLRKRYKKDTLKTLASGGGGKDFDHVRKALKEGRISSTSQDKDGNMLFKENIGPGVQAVSSLHKVNFI